VKFDDYSPRPSGILVLDVFRRGRLIEHFEEANLIVDGYKPTQAHLLGGDVTNRSVTQFGVGTSGVAPVPGNTALTSAFLKAIDSVDYPATDKVRFSFSLTTAEANGKAILEFGLLTAGSVLYARKVRTTALNKESDISFSGTWTITFP
jgi:hypothetical protein